MSDLKLIIDNKEILCQSIKIDYKENECAYYFKRGNYLYFRNDFYKIKVSKNDILNNYNFKVGEKVIINFL